MQDLMQSGRQRLFGVIRAASGPETDVTIGPHQHCSLWPEFTLLGPGPSRIDVIAAEDADTHRCQIDTELRPELLRRLDPWRTIFAGNQHELAVVNEGVKGNAFALPFDPGVRKRMTGLGAGFVNSYLVQGDVSGASVVNHGLGGIGITKLDVVVPKLHGLRYDRGIHPMSLLRGVWQVQP